MNLVFVDAALKSALISAGVFDTIALPVGLAEEARSLSLHPWT